MITWDERALKCGYPGGKKGLYGLLLATEHDRLSIGPFTNGMMPPFEDIPVPAESVEWLIEALQAGIGGRTMVEFTRTMPFEETMATGLMVLVFETMATITVMGKRGATKYFLQLPVSSLEEIVETLDLYNVVLK